MRSRPKGPSVDPLTADERCATPTAQARRLCQVRENSVMSSQVGSPRKLTHAQIRRVLRWHARRVLFRRTHGTMRSLAQSIGASIHMVRRALRAGSVGGTGHLSSQQRRIVKCWRARYRRFYETQLPAHALARALGVSRRTIFDCIRRRGRYLQLNKRALRQERAAPMRRWPAHAVTSIDVSQGSRLLKAWRAVDSAPGRGKHAPHRIRRPRRVTL